MSASRDHIALLVNGRKHQVRGRDTQLSLSDFLRLRLGKTGTKIVCAEGDCGSCTVLVGRPTGDRVAYLPVDSCLQFVFQLDGAHVVTIEGLAAQGGLTAVQQQMIDRHGSQCGFCTPGFVMAMTGLMEQSRCNGQPSPHANGHPAGCTLENKDSDQPICRDAWREGLSGNLCRCTGYVSIFESAEAAEASSPAAIADLYPVADVSEALTGLADQSVVIPDRVLSPVTLEEALQARADHPAARIIAGATDVGVQRNKGIYDPGLCLDLNRVTSLGQISDEQEALVCGSGVTWTELLTACEETLPQFADVLRLFGSPQIRHVGTIGGNIVNGSPIADSMPFFYVTETELKLQSLQGERWLNINEFYQGYKQFDLKPDELLTAVRIPKLSSDEQMQLYKVSRRRDMDISTFTAAIRMRVVGDVIESASIAYGAVGPTVLRLTETESWLVGKPFSLETMQQAGDLAIDEITPLSDVRGSSDYRYQLAKNVLAKFYAEQQSVAV